MLPRLSKLYPFRRLFTTSLCTEPPSVRPLISKMSHLMAVTFLGTSSGGGPSESRNCSSLVADVLGDGSLWMVDCAEGTLRQFAMQPGYGAQRLKVNRISKIFITHMHADHTMGITTLLRSVLGMPRTGVEPTQKPPKIEIYGPAGLRTFIRSIFKMTLTRTADRYVVHELLSAEDEITPCAPPELMHSSECVGNDIRAGEDGFWRDIVSERRKFVGVGVDAGPILHRDPCVGYIIREIHPASRKIVILGDTYDPSALIPLCLDPSPSLLIHEATDACIPSTIDPSAKRTEELVEKTAKDRGHSTPKMAGTFAKLIGTQKLLLNHIGSRFPAPYYNPRQKKESIRTTVMREIERQASEAWGMGTAEAAVDFMRVNVNVSGHGQNLSLDFAGPSGGGANGITGGESRGRGDGGRSDRGEGSNTIRGPSNGDDRGTKRRRDATS